MHNIAGMRKKTRISWTTKMHFNWTPLSALLPNQFHFDAFIRQFNFSVFPLLSMSNLSDDTICHILWLISSGLIVFHVGLFCHFPSDSRSSKNGSHWKPLTSCHLLYVLTHTHTSISFGPGFDVWSSRMSHECRTKLKWHQLSSYTQHRTTPSFCRSALVHLKRLSFSAVDLASAFTFL